MDIMDIASSAIQKVTSAYGKKNRREKTAPEIPAAFPVTITGKTWRAGFARREIMPVPSDHTYYIAGHGSGHKMEGVLTPVYVHAAWLDCGGSEGIFWLSADIVGMTDIEHEIIRRKIFQSGSIHGCKGVIFSCTHSHSGIDTVGYWGKPNAVSIPSDGKVPEYMEQLYDRSLAAAEEAYANRRPGKLFSGKVTVPDSLWSKRKFEDRHEVLYRLRFVPADGSAEIWFVNFGGHPNSLGGDNRLLSGEYPYFMREQLKAECGADVIFSIGAIGGMDAAMLETDQPLERVKYQGKLLADSLAGMTEETEQEPAIRFLRQQFYLPVSNSVLTLLAILGTMSFRAYPWPDSATGIAKKSEMTYLTLGKQKLLTLPGENFVNTVYGSYTDAAHSSTGMGPEVNPAPLCEICGDADLIAVGVTNDMTGYVVPPNDFVLNPTQPYLNGVHDRFDENHYHETNSMGPDTQRVIAETFAGMVERFGG